MEPELPDLVLPDHLLPEYPSPCRESPAHKTKAFVPNSCSLTETQDNLMRAAFVRATGRIIKVDNVASTLADVAGVPGSWISRKLLVESVFFVSCPSLI